MVTDHQHALHHRARNSRSPVSRHLTPLDRAVLIVILILCALVAGTILLGDRVGVQLTQVEPLGEAHSTSLVTIRFNEVMDHDSVTSRFHIEPVLQGAFTWSGTTMTFHPSEALQPGGSYTIALEPGALSVSRRKLLRPYDYNFQVVPLRVAYLYPADSAPMNIWIADPLDPENPQQITTSEIGIYDFGVSPEGTKIAFSESNLNGRGSDIKVIDLDSGALEQLTNCEQAACTTPVWRPDGRMIAYVRAEDDPLFGSSPPRIWLLDLSTSPVTTRPLFQQNQILGYAPQWSADGNRITLVDRGSEAIVVYDFTTEEILSISSSVGDSGSLSPDGTRLVYADVVTDPSGLLVNKLRIAEVDTGESTSLIAEEEPVNDQRAIWSPDNRFVAIARQDSRLARTIQIVLFDTELGITMPVTTDLGYSNLLFWWDPTGTELVVQRFGEMGSVNSDSSALTSSPQPIIWTIDTATGEDTLIAINGFLPRWVP